MSTGLAGRPGASSAVSVHAFVGVANSTPLSAGHCSARTEFVARQQLDSDINGAHMLPTEVLTPRELEIATLVARGHSNHQIADELAIASSTAERHVANILAKVKMCS